MYGIVVKVKKGGSLNSNCTRRKNMKISKNKVGVLFLLVLVTMLLGSIKSSSAVDDLTAFILAGRADQVASSLTNEVREVAIKAKKADRFEKQRAVLQLTDIPSVIITAGAIPRDNMAELNDERITVGARIRYNISSQFTIIGEAGVPASTMQRVTGNGTSLFLKYKF